MTRTYRNTIARPSSSLLYFTNLIEKIRPKTEGYSTYQKDCME